MEYCAEFGLSLHWVTWILTRRFHNNGNTSKILLVKLFKVCFGRKMLLFQPHLIVRGLNLFLLIRAIFDSYSLGNQSLENGVKILFGWNSIADCLVYQPRLECEGSTLKVDFQRCAPKLISQFSSPSIGVRMKEDMNLVPKLPQTFVANNSS